MVCSSSSDGCDGGIMDSCDEGTWREFSLVMERRSIQAFGQFVCTSTRMQNSSRKSSLADIQSHVLPWRVGAPSRMKFVLSAAVASTWSKWAETNVTANAVMICLKLRWHMMVQKCGWMRGFEIMREDCCQDSWERSTWSRFGVKCQNFDVLILWFSILEIWYDLLPDKIWTGDNSVFFRIRMSDKISDKQPSEFLNLVWRR